MAAAAGTVAVVAWSQGRRQPVWRPQLLQRLCSTRCQRMRQGHRRLLLLPLPGRLHAAPALHSHRTLALSATLTTSAPETPETPASVQRRRQQCCPASKPPQSECSTPQSLPPSPKAVLVAMRCPTIAPAHPAALSNTLQRPIALHAVLQHECVLRLALLVLVQAWRLTRAGTGLKGSP